MPAPVKPTASSKSNFRQPSGTGKRQAPPPRENVTALKQQIANLQKGQDGLQSAKEIKYLKGRISDLERTLKTKDEEIAKFKQEIANLDPLVPITTTA